jgi:3',5'-cyclic AMP phosphodiesterase CpdA
MEKGLKIVAVSDTHASSEQLEYLIHNKIQGDIFIHAGDFTRYGLELHFLNFIKLLKLLQFRHKIVVAGNHDILLDELMKP